MNEQAAKEQPTASRAQMKVFTILGEILTVLGPIGVLGLWLFQQTAVEQRSNAFGAYDMVTGHPVRFRAPGWRA